MRDYWQQPEETAKVMTPDGFFKSGDIGEMDARGYIKIVDRKKDMIVVSGFKVFPNEIEEVVASHPGVLECAAVGVPDEKSGEAVMLFVVRRDKSLTKEALAEYCATASSPATSGRNTSNSATSCPRPMSARSCAASCATGR